MVNVDRFWDPNNQYPNSVLAVYTHWVVEVSYRQHTLGSFIVFTRRKVTHLSQLNDQEMFELRDILAKTEATLSFSQVFHPDWINYLQMGNDLLGDIHHFGQLLKLKPLFLKQLLKNFKPLKNSQITDHVYLHCFIFDICINKFSFVIGIA